MRWWRQLRAELAELVALRRLERRVDKGLPVPEILEELAVLEARRQLRAPEDVK